jgi:hypothetical protein
LDFTLKTYRLFLDTLQKRGYSFYRFDSFLEHPGEKYIVLRHDVDKWPYQSLMFARTQHELGISGTYYFRTVPEGWDEVIIKEISNLGHEIGYHYEDFSLVAGRQKTKAKRQKKENIEKELAERAIESFSKNLNTLRELVPVKTICMHGSPMSRWDSRLLWKYYDYHDFGLIGEPYFDVNFNEVLYLTDTGRRWDGDSVNVRDKAEKRPQNGLKPSALSPQPSAPLSRFHSTLDIILAAEEGMLPDKIMMTFHPQRWTDNKIQWIQELVWQNIKNIGKYIILKSNKI